MYLHILFQIDHSGFESQKALQPKLLIVLFYVLFLCKCVLYYCHRVSAQLQLTNIWKYQINLCEFSIATLTWFYNVISWILDLVEWLESDEWYTCAYRLLYNHCSNDNHQSTHLIDKNWLATVTNNCFISSMYLTAVFNQ